MDLMTEIAKDVQPILRKILLEAAVKRELVNTNDYVRQVGKTTSLIRFAREFGFGVLVNHRETARYLRDLSGYDLIYAVDNPSIPSGKYVIDEMVRDINISSHSGIEVVTGYRNVSL